VSAKNTSRICVKNPKLPFLQGFLSFFLFFFFSSSFRFFHIIVLGAEVTPYLQAVLLSWPLARLSLSSFALRDSVILFFLLLESRSVIDAARTSGPPGSSYLWTEL
jgi:hypothetical protein